MKLVHGATYRATIRLGLFESVASNDAIREKLEAAGFTSVEVLGSGRVRSAQGIWNGPDMDADLPSQVTHVELA